METTATLNEITTLSIKDRILLVQAIWDTIAAEQTYPDLTEPQKRELDYRIDDYEMNPDNVLTWEEIKVSVKEVEKAKVERHLGAIDLSFATNIDNESIDADLAKSIRVPMRKVDFP